MLHEISHQTITPFNEHDHILHGRTPAMILMQIIHGANKSGAGCRIRNVDFTRQGLINFSKGFVSSQIIESLKKIKQHLLH